jgi:hypothetical protein
VELILFALFTACQGAVCALILRRVDGYEPAAVCDGCGGPLEVQADAQDGIRGGSLETARRNLGGGVGARLLHVQREGS